MSSKYVREQAIAFITTALAPVKVVDMTTASDNLDDFIADNLIGPEDEWVGIQFLPADERPVSLMANNSVGYYREDGGIFVHVVSPVKKTSKDVILDLSEILRDSLRGVKINGDIYVRGVTPPNYEAGGTLQMDGGFTSASVIVNYYRDFSL